MGDDINIWVACGDGRIDLVKEMIDGGRYDVNVQDSNGYTPIHAAVSWAHDDLVRYLLDRGADVNIRDTDGDTPLHVCESPAIAQIIMDAGGQIDAKNSEELTPMDVAREEKHTDMLEFYHQLGLLTRDDLDAAAARDSSEDQWDTTGSEGEAESECECDEDSEESAVDGKREGEGETGTPRPVEDEERIDR